MRMSDSMMAGVGRVAGGGWMEVAEAEESQKLDYKLHK